MAPDASIVDKIAVPYDYPRDVNDKKVGDFIKYTTEKLENAIRASKAAHEGLKVADLENRNNKQKSEEVESLAV